MFAPQCFLIDVIEREVAQQSHSEYVAQDNLCDMDRLPYRFGLM